MHSTVMIIPANLRDDADLLAVALGHAAPGDRSYTIPLGAGDTVTHWGLHTWADDDFLADLGEAAGGELPPVKWSDFGLTKARVTAVAAGLEVSAPGSGIDPEGAAHPWPADHMAAVLAALGLKRIGE
jgi:hypothetical protein